jgi:hypothetical protein
MSINRVSFTIREFVNREVYVCASHLIEELIEVRTNGGICRALSKREMYNHLKEFDLDNIDWPTDKETGDSVEVFEWWIVSSFMGRKLLEKEELIIKCGNLTIWGRTTTGQHITMDSVIEDIYDEIH